MKCTICRQEIEAQKNPRTGKVFWTKGHNAQPVSEGRCCSTCNSTVVIPARMKQIGGH